MADKIILTVDQALAWLKANRHFLNTTAIGRSVGIDPGTMSKILNEKTDINGVRVKLPVRTLPAISEIIQILQTLPAISEPDRHFLTSKCLLITSYLIDPVFQGLHQPFLPLVLSIQS